MNPPRNTLLQSPISHRTQQNEFSTQKGFRSMIVMMAILFSIKTMQQFFFMSPTRLLPYRILYDGESTSTPTTSTTFQTNDTSPALIPDEAWSLWTGPRRDDPKFTSEMLPVDITIDMISVGSTTRNEYQIQQERTFGSHKSIRNFYRMNEYNDTSDQHCSKKLSQPQMNRIIQFCNKQWDADDSTIRTWLRKRLKPFRYHEASTGWLCAQKRPIDALQWLVQQYRNHPNEHTIPDYVVLIDDDTYMNMEVFLQELYNYSEQQRLRPANSRSGSSSNDIPVLLGGCVLNFPRGLQFHFPQVGYGSIFSKATIQNLLRPIQCHYNSENDDAINYTNLDPFTRMACWRLYEQNHFNELQYFVDGMSVLDLMYNYTKSLSFLNIDSWRNGDGFCFHSDHALGYFLGFYHIAIPDHALLNAELSDNVRQQYPYGYSELTTTTNDDDNDIDGTIRVAMTDTINSQCSNSYYEQCSRDDMICHYIQPHQMERMHIDNVYYEDEVKMKLQLLQSWHQNESLAFDVISIGSLLKPELQAAQENTFGSHPSIRHWFRITELNDTDTTCSTELTMDHVAAIYGKCKMKAFENDEADTISEVSELIRRRLFYPKNHTGWMCAQKRPIDGLYMALQRYKSSSIEIDNDNIKEASALSLPNYLVIIDDDTYMNMNYLMEALPVQYPSFESYVITGCRLIHPKRIHFTFPFGGFGTILSRRAIENLIRPIYCNNEKALTQQHPWVRNELFDALACWRLQQNLFGEKVFFKDGMSVLDLLYAFSSGLSFTKVDEWKNGIDFCFHSDHALGYFLGFYHIAVTDERWLTIEMEMKNNPTKRIDTYLNDELRETFTYTGLKRDDISGCKYRGNRCTNDAPFCHYIDANHMERLYNIQMAIK